MLELNQASSAHPQDPLWQQSMKRIPPIYVRTFTYIYIRIEFGDTISAVRTENSVRYENAQLTTVGETIAASTMTSVLGPFGSDRL
jgi:hypothetical protein